jgi:hypothetical protein
MDWLTLWTVHQRPDFSDVEQRHDCPPAVAFQQPALFKLLQPIP